jgi:hypothetical protein
MAVFDSKFVADKAVDELWQNGFEKDTVEMFARPIYKKGSEANELNNKPIQNEIFINEQGAGLRIGAGIGGGMGIAGGLLASSGAIALPVLGPLLAGGALGAIGVALGLAALSAAAGGVVGGVLGDLLGLGISEDELRQYARNVREDQVVVAVLADWGAVDPAMQILEKHNPLVLEEKPYTRQMAGLIGKTTNAARVKSRTREGEERR